MPDISGEQVMVTALCTARHMPAERVRQANSAFENCPTSKLCIR